MKTKPKDFNFIYKWMLEDKTLPRSISIHGRSSYALVFLIKTAYGKMKKNKQWISWNEGLPGHILDK